MCGLLLVWAIFSVVCGRFTNPRVGLCGVVGAVGSLCCVWLFHGVALFAVVSGLFPNPRLGLSGAVGAVGPVWRV